MFDGRWVIFELVVLCDLFRVVVIGLKLSILYCFKICVIDIKKGEDYLFSLESKVYMILELLGLKMLECLILIKYGNFVKYYLFLEEILEVRNEIIKFKKFFLGKSCDRIYFLRY